MGWKEKKQLFIVFKKEVRERSGNRHWSPWGIELGRKKAAFQIIQSMNSEFLVKRHTVIYFSNAILAGNFFAVLYRFQLKCYLMSRPFLTSLCKIARIFSTLCAFTLLLLLFLLKTLKCQLQCVCIFFSVVSVTSHYNQLYKKRTLISVIFLVYKTLPCT